MVWIVDRIEGDLAVMTCGDHVFDVPLVALPTGLREGDALDVTPSSAGQSDGDAIKKRLAVLAQADDGEDFSL